MIFAWLFKPKCRHKWIIGEKGPFDGRLHHPNYSIPAVCQWRGKATAFCEAEAHYHKEINRLMLDRLSWPKDI